MESTEADIAKIHALEDEIKGLKEKLFPHNELQERFDNFIPYYLNYGNDFIRSLKKELTLLEKKFTVFME